MEPLVQLTEGQIKGSIRINSNDEPIYSFTCIPYGKAPVGNLRFKAPEPVEPWAGIKDATREENYCFQKNGLTQEINGSEDCLSLHVFTKKLPRDEKKLKPVMVYIHGGGFMVGSHETSMYGPEYLMNEEIVLVSITYRVGFLGFLTFNDLSLDVPGNAGLKDQVLALKWVQKNIKHFNGDPNNVTIFGISAGGASVEYLIVSPTTKNLFHKAIIQSGSTLNPWARGYFEPADLASYLGKPNLSEKELLKILEEMPIKKLFETQTSYIRSKKLIGNFGLVSPVVEKPNRTAFLTKEPMEIIQSGNYNSVPVIIGYADREGALLMLFEYMAKQENRDISYQYTTEKMFYNQINLKDVDKVKKICGILDNFYGKEENKNGRMLLAADALFAAGIRISAKNLAKFSKNPVYMYRFSLDTNLNVIKKMANINECCGACHGDDIGYFFKTFMPLNIGNSEKTAQKKLFSLWINFAKYSDPTPVGNDLNLKWKPVESDELQFLHISTEFKMDVNPDADKMALWNQIYKMNPTISKYIQ